VKTAFYVLSLHRPEMGKRVIGRRTAHEWTDCIRVNGYSAHCNEEKGNVKIQKFLDLINHELLFASSCTNFNKVNFKKGDGQREFSDFEILESW
jgi:hypothetical protein